jgi:phage N-6-adenine-methyltransferase
MIYSGNKLDDWETPKELFEKLDSIFEFSFDLAASEKNKKTKKFFSVKEDSLSQDWNDIFGTAFLNPPFSKAKSFFKKASESKNPIVAIYKSANVESQTWQDFIFPHAQVFFLRGRVNFEGKENATSPTFGSALIFYRTRMSDALSTIDLFDGSFVVDTLVTKNQCLKKSQNLI